MQNDSTPRSPSVVCRDLVLMAAAIVFAAAVLLAMGRLLICKCGYVRF